MPHGARYWKFIFSPSKVQKLLVKQTPLAKALFWEGILVVAKRKNGIGKQLVPDAVSMAGDGKVDKIKAGGRSTSPRKKSPPRKSWLLRRQTSQQQFSSAPSQRMNRSRPALISYPSDAADSTFRATQIPIGWKPSDSFYPKHATSVVAASAAGGRNVRRLG